MTMLHICDYGSGNIHNVERALVRVGAEVRRCTSAEELDGAHAIVIPGVGAFGDCISALRERGFEDPIKELAASGTWILGICVGMQILATHSEEFGIHRGLDIIPGAVRMIPGKTPDGESLKRPHVGWSNLHSGGAHWEGTPLEKIRQESPVYFVHSYELHPADHNHLLAYARYGGCDIVAAVRRGRIFGVQFHPEKSGFTGLNILETFVSLAASTQT